MGLNCHFTNDDIQMVEKHMKKSSMWSITRVMQIKTTRRYLFTSTRMAKIKKTDNSKCCWGCGDTGIPINCWWDCKKKNGVFGNFRKTGWQFFKWINRVIIRPSISTGRENWKQISTQKFAHGDFHWYPVVENPPCNAEDMGSIPGQGTKMPRSMEQLSPCTTATELKHHD